MVLEALLRRRAVALAAAEPDVDSLAESMGPLLSLRLGARLLARAALFLVLLLKGLSFDAAVRPLLPRPAPCALRTRAPRAPRARLMRGGQMMGLCAGAALLISATGLGLSLVLTAAMVGWRLVEAVLLVALQLLRRAQEEAFRVMVAFAELVSDLQVLSRAPPRPPRATRALRARGGGGGQASRPTHERELRQGREEVLGAVADAVLLPEVPLGDEGDGTKWPWSMTMATDSDGHGHPYSHGWGRRGPWPVEAPPPRPAQ